MRLFFPFFLAALIGWMAPAAAQVQRCTDTRTGQVTYTDGPCPSHQRSVEVLPAQTPEEKAAQARQYEEAQARWQAEQARTEALRRAEAEKAAAQAAAAAAQRPPVQIQLPPPAEPQVVPYPVYPYPPAYPPGHRPRPPHGKPPPPEPEGPWQCNVFRCYDGKGNVRPRP
ncbi:DUF4124 domain-containing protein [Comamonas nitrativorans]